MNNYLPLHMYFGYDVVFHLLYDCSLAFIVHHSDLICMRTMTWITWLLHLMHNRLPCNPCHDARALYIESSCSTLLFCLQ